MPQQVEQLLTDLILRTELHIYLGYEEARADIFEPGWCAVTPAARALLEENDQPAFEFLHRHLIGDWTQMSEEEQQANEEAVRAGFPVQSRFRTRSGATIYVRTEADRSATTVRVAGEDEAAALVDPGGGRPLAPDDRDEGLFGS